MHRETSETPEITTGFLKPKSKRVMWLAKGFTRLTSIVLGSTAPSRRPTPSLPSWNKENGTPLVQFPEYRFRRFLIRCLVLYLLFRVRVFDIFIDLFRYLSHSWARISPQNERGSEIAHHGRPADDVSRPKHWKASVARMCVCRDNFIYYCQPFFSF